MKSPNPKEWAVRIWRMSVVALAATPAASMARTREWKWAAQTGANRENPSRRAGRDNKQRESVSMARRQPTNRVQSTWLEFAPQRGFTLAK